MTDERRKQVDLRDLVEKATAGMMPHLADKVKDVARRAYYLGVLDGMNAAENPRELTLDAEGRRVPCSRSR